MAPFFYGHNRELLFIPRISLFVADGNPAWNAWLNRGGIFYSTLAGGDIIDANPNGAAGA